jgi:ketopantoate reductase
MGIITELFKRKAEKTIQFRGQGYSEEGALHHAEQRFHAWLREKEEENKPIQSLSQNIHYERKNELLYICKINCIYKN